MTGKGAGRRKVSFCLPPWSVTRATKPPALQSTEKETFCDPISEGENSKDTVLTDDGGTRQSDRFQRSQALLTQPNTCQTWVMRDPCSWQCWLWRRGLHAPSLDFTGCFSTLQHRIACPSESERQTSPHPSSLSSASSSSLLSKDLHSNLVHCLTSHTALFQNSCGSPDLRHAFLLAGHEQHISSSVIATACLVRDGREIKC